MLFIWKDSFLKEADFSRCQDSQGWGNCLWLHAPGVGNRTSIEEKSQIPVGVSGGGDGNSTNSTMHNWNNREVVLRK